MVSRVAQHIRSPDGLGLGEIEQYLLYPRDEKRASGWKVLNTIPFLGLICGGHLLAIIRTPSSFRTKRNLWPYAGLAVVRQRSTKAPMTRGLNRNHNPLLKSVFKGAANGAVGKPGPRREYDEASVGRGVEDDMAKVTLARKIASVALRRWKKGEVFDGDKLTMQAT